MSNQSNNEVNNTLTVTFPNTAAGIMLHEAVGKALADAKFMGTTSKINNAVEALTPKDTLSGILKRLQNNANKDFLDKKDKGAIGYTEQNRAEKIKAYVQERFQVHMDNPTTSVKAIKLFNDAYPPSTEAQQAG